MATDTMSGNRRRDLPPPQAHRSAGTRFLIAVIVVLIVLFALVVWSRYHRSAQPPTPPMHQNSQLVQPRSGVRL